MNPHNAPSDTGFEQAIADYAAVLSAIEQATPSPSFEQMLEVLVARDTVEALRLSAASATGQSLAELVQLDRRLKTQAKAWTPIAQLADCRQTMQPPESSWWWHLEPPPAPEPWLSRFDWVWNLLTVGCLVITGTFATSTARAFSTSGFDLLTTFSTIAQGAGLVLVAGGALTDQGQKNVEKIWNSLKIPNHLHAEATFAVAGLLLLTSYNIYRNLPQIGGYYDYQGKTAEADNQWLVAKDKYERALKFIPPSETNIQANLQISLGQIHERLGQLEEAQKYYEEAALSNDPAARIRLGRINLLQALQASLWTGQVTEEHQPKLRNAENYLDLAQQNLADKPIGNEQKTKEQKASLSTQRLRQEVYMNQGILLWAKAHLEAPDRRAKDEWLDEAEANFKQAADLEYDLPTVASGRRADCYYKLAIYLNTKIQTKKRQGTTADLAQLQTAANDCIDRLAKQPSRDLYDVFLMSRAIKAKLGRGTPANQNEQP